MPLLVQMSHQGGEDKRDYRKQTLQPIGMLCELRYTLSHLTYTTDTHHVFPSKLRTEWHLWDQSGSNGNKVKTAVCILSLTKHATTCSVIQTRLIKTARDSYWSNSNKSVVGGKQLLLCKV